MQPARSAWFVALLAAITSPLAATADWVELGDASSQTVENGTLKVKCDRGDLRISAINDHVLRVRVGPDGRFGRDFSWAVVENSTAGKLNVAGDSRSGIRAELEGLVAQIDSGPFRLGLQHDGETILTMSEPDGIFWWKNAAPSGSNEVSNGAHPVCIRFQLPDNASIFGLGEKTGPLDKRNRAWTMWNTDEGAYGVATDPIYKTVPFFIIARAGKYHGVFLDNPWRTSFDLGHTSRGVLKISAEGGELDLYFIAGPDPKDVIRRYTALTGRMELPPKWAIGYHQCRYSYYPEERVRKLARTFREKGIPCDVLYYDIDYMDEYRCFTWDKRWFPNPRKLNEDLNEMGFRTVAIIDPGIKEESGYFVYDQGSAIDAWVDLPSGEPYVGRVWPGKTVWPDFTNPTVRDWWAGLFVPFIRDCGLDGVWNDMNEPADFDGPNKTVPLDTRFDNEGNPASHRACHNVYGQQMSRATHEGLQRAYPDRRPFTITRATYAGGQRYACVWTGDNISTWDHLRMSITMVLGLGVSGFPFSGPDIGGFVAGASPELYARWIQVGALMPFSRTHTAKGNLDQEPWSFGPEVEQIARQSLRRRYEWLPYIYTLFEESTRTGLPIVRPVWLEYPDQRRWDEDQVFLLGSDIYVAPHVYPDARAHRHWLPPGVWYDGTTGLVHASGQPIQLDNSLETLPHFFRAGAIIPMQSPVQSTTETPDSPLILDVWPFGESTATLYEDDGASFDYRDGGSRRTTFECRRQADHVYVVMNRPEGTYVPPPRTPLIRLHGIPGQLTMVSGVRDSGGQEDDDEDLKNTGLSYRYYEATNAWLIPMFPDNGAKQTFKIAWDPAREQPGAATFEFSDAAESIAHKHWIWETAADGKITRLRIQHDWEPYVVLRRTRFSADDRPILHIRLATENTSKIGLRFATEQNPLLSDREPVSIEVTPDSRMHEYVVDLADATDGAWAGTVYYLRLDFLEGTQEGEWITLDELTFQPRF